MDREATTFATTNHRSGCVGGVRHGAFRRWWLRRSSPEYDMDLLLFFIFVFGWEKWWRGFGFRRKKWWSELFVHLV